MMMIIVIIIIIVIVIIVIVVIIIIVIISLGENLYHEERLICMKISIHTLNNNHIAR